MAIWVQCPLKFVSEASQNNYFISSDFDQLLHHERTNPQYSHSGSTVIQVLADNADDEKLRVTPITQGFVRFQPNSSSAVNVDNPEGIFGTFHFRTNPDIWRQINAMMPQVSVPSHFFYENVELDNLAVTQINEKLLSKPVRKEGRPVDDLRVKRELFLQGKVGLPVDKDDYLGKVRAQGTDYLLGLIGGGKLVNSFGTDDFDADDFDADDFALTPDKLVAHWPIPVAYFYKNLLAGTNFLADGHESHPLLEALTNNRAGSWTRVRISKISMLNYSQPTMDIQTPRPQPGIEDYNLKIVRGSSADILQRLPEAGETFIRRQAGDVTLAVIRHDNTVIIPVRVSSIIFEEPYTFDISQTLDNDVEAIELEHISTLGTYAIISLGTRRDAQTFAQKLDAMGLSPMVKPAVGGLVNKVDIMAVLASSPNWLFLGGHFDKSLFNDDIDKNIELTFFEDRIELTHPAGDETLWKASHLNLHSNLTAVFFGGCSLLGRDSKKWLSRFAKLLNNIMSPIN